MKDPKKVAAGLLGAIKSAETAKKQMQLRESKYLESPKKCKTCSKIIPYLLRKNKFCDHSCAAIATNNKRSSQAQTTWTCLGCGKIHQSVAHKVNKYCGHVCQRLVTKANTLTRLKAGELTDRSVIRKTLIREFGHKCWQCELVEWQGHKIPLELDHIDGDAGNNRFDNLRVLCPNCHSVTPTWKGKNKGSGRDSRGLPLN